MPRVAIISDIHGNVPALDAVLADLDAQDPDEVLVGGDLVGRGPQGSEVVQRIRSRGWRSVRGNHEDYLLDFIDGRVPDGWMDAEEWAAPRWMANELTEDDARFIEALPLALHSEAIPDLRLVHGTVLSNNEGIGPWTSDAELAGHLELAGKPILVCGHTHRPLDRNLPAGHVINAGSVGLPFNRDRRAQYAIVDGDGVGSNVEFRQVEYDQREIFEVYESSGFVEAAGATALLLRFELLQARPFLVPFLRWADASGFRPTLERVDAFLEFYDADESLSCFFGRLQELRA